MRNPFLRFCAEKHYIIRQTIRDEIEHMVPAAQLPQASYDLLCMQKQFPDKMSDSLPKSSGELAHFKSLFSTLYSEDTNGFCVNAPPKDMQKNFKDQVVKYMIRYASDSIDPSCVEFIQMLKNRCPHADTFGHTADGGIFPFCMIPFASDTAGAEDRCT